MTNIVFNAPITANVTEGGDSFSVRVLATEYFSPSQFPAEIISVTLDDAVPEHVKALNAIIELITGASVEVTSTVQFVEAMRQAAKYSVRNTLVWRVGGTQSNGFIGSDYVITVYHSHNLASISVGLMPARIQSDPDLYCRLKAEFELAASFTNVSVPTAQVLVNSTSGLTTSTFTLPKTTIDFDLHYGPGAEECLNTVKSGITAMNRGLVLLHGPPGTGKTTFVRRLISDIPHKTAIVVSPDLFESFGGPELMRFLINRANTSMIVIEDAERLLLKRAGGDSSAISILLNMGDGLLADALAMPIICTFNSDITNIDSAILRPGRLLAKHEFKDLDRERAFRLASTLGVDPNTYMGSDIKSASVASVYGGAALVKAGDIAAAKQLVAGAHSKKFGFG